VTFRRYLDRHCVHWSYNDVQLQSAGSRFCGHYCVLYYILRSRGIDMRSIVCSFTRDTGLTMCWCMDLYVCNKCNVFVIFLIAERRVPGVPTVALATRLRFEPGPCRATLPIS